MSNRKVEIEDANSVQVVSGDVAIIFNLQLAPPEAAKVIQAALNQGKQLESIDAQGVFHNLPFPRNPNFTGREQILEQIEKNLKQKDAAAITQTQAIHGLGGIGKTQIAIEYAYRHLKEYRYIFWVEAESDASFSKSFSQIASILNLPQASEKDKSLLNKAVLSWFENHQDCLLIFDNAEDVKNLQPYLPRTESGQIIITTRAVAMAGIAKSVELDKMEADSAVEFLFKRAGISNPDENQVESAKEICRLLDHLPLAIDHAGAYIESTRCQLAEYKEYFKQHGAKILADDQYASANYNKTVATTWTISIEKLNATNPAAVALLTASCYLAPDDIPIELFTKGHEQVPPTLKETAKDEFRFNQALGDLQKYSLIRRQQGDKNFSIHRLVQSVIHDSQGEDMHKEMLESMVECLANYIPDVADFKNWSVTEKLISHADYLFAATKKYNVETEPLAMLLNKLGFYLIQRAVYENAEPLFKRATSIIEKKFGNDDPRIATFMCNLGSLYGAQSRFEEGESVCKRAIRISEKAFGNNDARVSVGLNNLAEIYREKSDIAEAIPLYKRALEIDEEKLGKDHHDVAIDLNNLALCLVSLGRYTEAEPLYKRALEIRERAFGKNHPGVATTLNNLAVLYRKTGRFAEAESLYKRALKISEWALGKDHPSIAVRLNNLAHLYQRQDRYRDAEPLFQRAIKIFDYTLGSNHPKTLLVIEGMADLYHKWGKKDKAAEYAKRAEKAKAKD